MDTKRQKRIQRHKRVRARVRGTAGCLRLSVFRSNKHIFLQLINDEEQKTVLGIGDFLKKGKSKDKNKETKVEKARRLGEKIAELALKAGVKKVVFDRGGYFYHGRIKAAAEGARKGGLNF
ncbi:MAG: 50S ribosomal protein L18 [Candidatus Niyogibacteria bacterium]|nr:50S ribosomal protein L18 [Candidatus Niyogibacteria bacterium]